MSESKLLRSIRIMKPDEVLAIRCRDSTDRRTLAEQEVAGFRQEKGVDPESQTDTYAAGDVLRGQLALGGCAVLIRTGKQLPKRVTRNRHPVQQRAASRFSAGQGAGRRDAESADPAHPAGGGDLAEVRFEAAGRGDELRPVSMDFNYGCELRRAVAHGL